MLSTFPDLRSASMISSRKLSFLGSAASFFTSSIFRIQFFQYFRRYCPVNAGRGLRNNPAGISNAFPAPEKPGPGTFCKLKKKHSKVHIILTVNCFARQFPAVPGIIRLLRFLKAEKNDSLYRPLAYRAEHRADIGLHPAVRIWPEHALGEISPALISSYNRFSVSSFGNRLP